MKIWSFLMLSRLGRIAPRLLKELVFAVVVAILAEPVIQAFRGLYSDRVRDLEEEVVAQGDPVDRSGVSSAVIPPPPASVPAVVEKQPVVRVEPPPRVLADGSTIYTRHCDTPDGEHAKFEIVVFSESYSWVYSCIDKVQIHKTPVSEARFLEVLSSEGYREVLGNALEIIVAGTASCEGGDWLKEEGRALSRALTLRDLVEQTPHARRQPRSVHTLNLGRYQETCGDPQPCHNSQSDNTWHQRKIILIAILERSHELDDGEIEWCVKKSLSEADQLGSLMKHYCRHDLNKDLNGNPI